MLLLLHIAQKPSVDGNVPLWGVAVLLLLLRSPATTEGNDDVAGPQLQLVMLKYQRDVILVHPVSHMLMGLVDGYASHVDMATAGLLPG